MRHLFYTIVLSAILSAAQAQEIRSVNGQLNVSSVSDVSALNLIIRAGGKEAKDIVGVEYVITVIDANKKESVYKLKATEAKGGWQLAFKAPVKSVEEVRAVASLYVKGYEKPQNWALQFNLGTGTRTSATQASNKAELL